MNIDHILNHKKIVENFNISKRMSVKEIGDIKRMVERSCDDKKSAQRLFKKELARYTEEYTRTHSIPGIIVKNDDNTFEWARKNNSNKSPNEMSNNSQTTTTKETRKIEVRSDVYKEIQRDAICVSNYFTNDKKFTTKQLVFFIITLISAMGIEQEDFTKFYKNINESGKLDDEDEDEDEDGD